MNKKEKSDIILYTSPDGQVKVEVFFQGDTAWLTLNRMAELFGTSKQNVSYHLQNIYDKGELSREATVKEIMTVQKEGGREVKRKVEYYSLDAIISVGYRVNSERATQFRVWATRVLHEYIIKGFAIDDERLKSGKTLRQSYFDELLERIRDIRASERLFYQKITDIYAQCSADYDPHSKITQDFYATVQNKLHWAIHGHTAAELIVRRADAAKPHMGLTTWKNGPKGKIRKTDVAIAKNYLNEKELRQLNRIVSMYLDYAEMQAENQHAMSMTDWVSKLDAFLYFNEKDVLKNPGKVSAEVAKELAEQTFAKYEENIRRIETTEPVSDFDLLVEKTKFIEKKKDKKGH
ncbi:virulence RhuM family protein [Candidatus Saganbacteria bacterium]|nr:virulence RhuM family protein [Candidatus Saganbacteria bacterium]